MNEASITQYLTDTFGGVEVVVASQESGDPEMAWGDRFFFSEPARALPADRRLPFATIVTKDYGDFDAASHLNRPGVFRLNIGIGRETYRALFGAPASASDTGDDGEGSYDFTALDQLMPHPVYGRMYWVCILNPSDATFHSVVRPLLAEAYDLAATRDAKHTARG